ncbi:MAG: O-methyltransferase [Bryobacteraceae bacterium]
MRRTLVVAALFLGACTLLAGGGIAGWNLYRLFGKESIPTPALAISEGESRILATIAWMEKGGTKRFGVPESDGRLLRWLVEAVEARNVVEIGTSTGYSGLWLSLGLHSTGGRLTTFEVDPGRAAAAREHFRKAGVEDQVNVVVGDAHRSLAGLKEPIDLVFIDADKEGYVDYAKQILPVLRPGGLILAHNVGQAPEYISYVAASPDLDTVLLTRTSGMSATLKRSAQKP